MIATEALTRTQDREGARPDGLDALTGLPGPTFWRLVLAAESSRCARYGRTGTVVLVSVVRLERVARSVDPDCVATVLVRLARILRSGTRTSDHVARLGETRFAILLTETGEVAAVNVVERVRERCERALSSMAPGVRVAFGWASPSGTGTLLRASASAELRLRRETARIMAERPGAAPK
jgi:diguanylate cyclase (GGDEF)-like protein